MQIDASLVVGTAIGLVAGALLAVSLSYPRVASGLGKFTAVVLIGAGAGLITWGLIGALNREAFEPLRMGPVTFYTPAQILGWGTGLLGSGITSLVLSFAGRRTP